MPARVSRPKDEENNEPDPVEPTLVEPTEEPELELEPEVDFEPDEDELKTDFSEEDFDGPLTLEDADPTAELWDDGPTVADALAWKEEHGDIYVTTITYDKYVIWKTLDRSEYRQVVTKLEDLSNEGASPVSLNLYQEEFICKLCILSPQFTDFDKELAGLPSLLSQQILEASGFTAIDTRGL